MRRIRRDRAPQEGDFEGGGSEVVAQLLAPPRMFDAPRFQGVREDVLLEKPYTRTVEVGEPISPDLISEEDTEHENAEQE